MPPRKRAGVKALGSEYSALRMKYVSSRSHEVEAERYDGLSNENIVNLAGADLVSITAGGAVQVKASDNSWITVQPCWWVIKHLDGDVEIMSSRAINRYFSH